MLQLQVLGSPTVSGSGGARGGVAAQRKALALLALLAGAGRRGVSRDKVLAMLWPETPADRATHRLNQLLYSLRRDLDAAELFLGSAELRLSPDVLAVDLAEFTAALEAGDFARAVAVYGGPFLDGFYLSDAPEFEHWVEEERTRLGQRHSSALEALARAAAEGGNLVAAAGWWRQLAQLEPLNARVAVCYMEALGAAGDRPAALRFAKAYETLLRQEFDTDPDPTVLAAAERLKRPSIGFAAGAAPAIAVLPFVNLTPDGEGEYFSDGLTEELTNALARTRGLRVASRTSVYALRGKGLDARELGERLGVSALVEGTVRKVGNRIRLSARLVNAADGCQIWSDAYERTLEDMFALQEELSRALTAALPLGVGRAATPMRQPTAALDAYTLYLRGRYAAQKRTPEGLSLGIEYFEQAIERDPGYALAHAGLAECWALRGFQEFGDLEWPVAVPRARAAALDALRLDPQLAKTHIWLGLIHFVYDWDWAAAEAEFRRALQMDPADAIAETWYAVFLGAMGRHEESLRRILHAEAVEPLALQIRLCVGRCYIYARRFDQAYDALAGLLKSEPGHRLTTIWLARALCGLNRPREAVDVLERLPAEEHTPHVRSVLAYALAASGRGDEARALCRGLEEDFVEGRTGALGLAPVVTRLGDTRHAMELVQEAVRRRDTYVPWLARDERYDALRDLPAYSALLRELRLKPSQEAFDADEVDLTVRP
ncbi:MAG TPA: tetratricopeptide repeat protein [Gemmatimonadales bacterium]|nr:tetratricopeptide repeat protein [Gemmatimonadales bacterium]